MSFFKMPNVVNKADKISNFSVSTAEYGAPVLEILGTTRISGNVIYYDDFTANEHKETTRAGKGGGKTTNITYTYSVACIIGLCEGEIAGISRIWQDKEVYQYPHGDMTCFTGSATQKPWAYTTSKHPDKALAYPNLAYMAGVIDLGTSASLPNYNFEVRGKLLNTGDGVDVNPADYIAYILQKVGLGDIEIVGLDTYRQYCQQADLLISTPNDQTSTKAARDIINEIAELTNVYMFWSNDRFKIVPRADRPIGTWQPNKTITYNLTADDFIEQSNGACVTYTRKDSSEVYNRFSVEFLNRSNSYEKETVSYEDVEDINEYGTRQASTVSAHYIYTKQRALKIAEEMARKAKYERNKYTFKLDWAFCRLEVGDLVTLTDANIGLNKQVAMIDSVTEDSGGLLTFTAISRADGNYTNAVYDVHEVDRPFVDFNASPDDVDTPAIFQPPSELTANGNELWLAVKGKSAMWGGCNVFVSDNNERYNLLGKITNNARIGKLGTAMTSTSTSMNVIINDVLLSGSKTDAERGNTLLYVDGECLSYTTATLNQNGSYTLTGVIRGQYNTKAVSHSANAVVVRCDSALLKTNIRKEDVGKKIWLKFTSYNIFGNNEQNLSDVTAYTYNLTSYNIPNVSNVTAYNRYTSVTNGVARYDIVIKWNAPQLATYLQGDVWYKVKNGTAYPNEWSYGGSGINECVIPQAQVGDTYKIAVCTKDSYGESVSADSAPQAELLVALKLGTPNTPANFTVAFGAEAVASWSEVTNADVAYYELRTDNNAGMMNAGLLARTNSTKASIELSARSSTLYLFACSATGEYSTPAKLTYNKPAPTAPTNVKINASMGGISVVANAIPNGCNGMVVYIGDKVIKTANSSYSHACEAGMYSVSVAYSDIFGVGVRSAEKQVFVTVKVNADNIEDNAITSSKIATGAVVANKIDVQSLSAISATIGTLRTATTGARLEIKDNLLLVYDENNTLRVRLGVW